MKSKWEQIAAFPSIEDASSPTKQGSRLMDIVAHLGCNSFSVALLATGFVIDEAHQSVNIWVREAVSLVSSSPKSTQSDDTVPSSTVSRIGSKGRISTCLKAETKNVIIDIFPRDEFGFYLTKDTVDPTLRRPKWVMDEFVSCFV
jgi:hypothetical protein